MSKQHETGGPAFPVPEHLDERGNGHEQSIGMTLRDWFAGQALASMTIAPDYSKGPCNASMADRAYHIADAMLAAREAA